MSRFDSISIRKLSIRFSIFLITFSEYSFNTKAIDISKEMNSKYQFTNGELLKRN